MSCKTCFDNKLLAILSAASWARLVEMSAMRAPAGMLGPTRSGGSRLGSVVCHSLLWGCLTIASEAGGGGRTADLSAELGKIGGLTGGGGLEEVELASVG